MTLTAYSPASVEPVATITCRGIDWRTFYDTLRRLYPDAQIHVG